MARGRAIQEEETPLEEPRSSWTRRSLAAAGYGTGAAALALAFVAFVLPPQPSDDLPVEFGPPETYRFTDIIVSLADNGRDAALKVTLILEFRAVDARVVQQRIKVDQAEAIRDTLVTHLSSKVSSEIKQIEGKTLLKLSLIDALTPYVFPRPNEGVITNLFFGEFLIQQ